MAASLSAQVKFSRDQIDVVIDGKPFTTFYDGAENGKPFFSPLRSASGKVVSRLYPMMQVPGESRDHLHHTGLWFSYDDVNGVDGERLGIAIFDHPSNPRHPTYWHARDYGLFALDPFGQNAFDPSKPESHWKLSKGQKLAFRWRVVIHTGDAESGHVAELYKQYAAE